jgi:hypothetical protein
MAPGWRFVFAGGGTGKLAIVNRLFAIANEYHYRYPEPQAISRPRFAAMGDFLIEALHLKEKDRLRRFFLRRLQDHHDAADAIQETFLRLPIAPLPNGWPNGACFPLIPRRLNGSLTP